MRNIHKKRLFLKNEEAVSEEFTVLPALSIVMIGFALFIVLIAQAYVTYEERMTRVQNYQTASSLIHKLVNPDCYFIRNEGLIDLPLLQTDRVSLKELCDRFEWSGYSFFIRLHWGDYSKDFPDTPLTLPKDRIALSTDVGVYLNEAQTIPGTLTVILWRGFS